MQLLELMEIVNKAVQSNNPNEMYKAFLEAKDFVHNLKEANSNNTELKPIFEKFESILEDLENGFKLKTL